MPVAQLNVPTAIDAIREARAELLATHGSCCADAPSVLFVTACRIIDHAPVTDQTRLKLHEELAELLESVAMPG